MRRIPLLLQRLSRGLILTARFFAFFWLLGFKFVEIVVQRVVGAVMRNVIETCQRVSGRSKTR